MASYGSLWLPISADSVLWIHMSANPLDFAWVHVGFCSRSNSSLWVSVITYGNHWLIMASYSYISLCGPLGFPMASYRYLRLKMAQ